MTLASITPGIQQAAEPSAMAPRAPSAPKAATPTAASRDRRSQNRPSPARPDPGRLAAVLVRAWIDVRTGHRPLRQVERLLAPALTMRLAAQIATSARTTDASPVVRTITTQWPRLDACEAVVLVTGATRVTAIAVRLEIHRGAWRAVEMAAPEAGIPATRTMSRPEASPTTDAFDDLLEPDELSRLDQAVAAESRPLRLRGNA